MKNEQELWIDVETIPEPARLYAERAKKYGSVPGLDDWELADPDVLERWAFVEAWRPILELPTESSEWRPHGVADDDGHIDFGAFGTVDFERMYPTAWSGSRRRSLSWQLKVARVMLDGVRHRVAPAMQRRILTLLRDGQIEFEHIADDDMQSIAKWWSRVRGLRAELKLA